MFSCRAYRAAAGIEESAFRLVDTRPHHLRNRDVLNVMLLVIAALVLVQLLEAPTLAPVAGACARASARDSGSALAWGRARAAGAPAAHGVGPLVVLAGRLSGNGACRSQRYSLFPDWEERPDSMARACSRSQPLRAGSSMHPGDGTRAGLPRHTRWSRHYRRQSSRPVPWRSASAKISTRRADRARTRAALGAGLLTRALSHAMNLDPGFQSPNSRNHHRCSGPGNHVSGARRSTDAVRADQVGHWPRLLCRLRTRRRHAACASSAHPDSDRNAAADGSVPAGVGELLRRAGRSAAGGTNAGERYGGRGEPDGCRTTLAGRKSSRQSRDIRHAGGQYFDVHGRPASPRSANRDGRKTTAVAYGATSLSGPSSSCEAAIRRSGRD